MTFHVRQRRAHAVRLGLLCALVPLLPARGFAGQSFSHFGFERDSYSPEGQAGLDEILSGRMFNVTIPWMLFSGRLAMEDKAMAKLGFEPGSAEGRFYTNGSLPPPPADEASGPSLGLSRFRREGRDLISFNCFACHAGVVEGMVVAGLGSNSIIQQASPSAAARGDNVRGDNYGQYAVWLYAAKVADPRNTGLITSDERTPLVELIESTKLPPVQSMPWWLMKYKVRDYWYGDGAPDDAAHFSLNFTISSPDVNERHASHVESTARALAFARETRSPAFPGSLDAGLVHKGADLFHGRTSPENQSTFRACSECHGTYTRKPSAPDMSRPGSWSVNYTGSEELRDVGTDPEYNAVIRKFEPIIEHLRGLEDYYKAQGTPELFPEDDPLDGVGYVPPPLVGVWATAPYFHNGSVPTIEAVLNSELRPEIWERGKSAHDYDLARVGLEHAPVSREDFAAKIAAAESGEGTGRAAYDLLFVYDTEGFGRDRSGHTFGDSLTDEERSAVIEFLKSLSGPDM